MSTQITYFVHGTTTDNEKDLATGWLPGELSKKGIEQAKELGNLVEDKHFDVIFCSDLKGAVDSAKLGFGNKYKIIEDSRLRECNYGDYNGKSSEFKDGHMIEYIKIPFPNGESYKDVENRMKDFLKTLNKDYLGKHIAIVAAIGALVFIVIDMQITGISNRDYMDVFAKWPKETDDIVRVEVLGQQWAWNFRYAGKDGIFNTEDDIVTLNDLRLPVGKKIVFQVTAKDVIHSFSLPNTRLKVDAMPGRVAKM